MLSTMRSSWLLFALLALVALSTAFSVEDAINLDGINAYLHYGVKRQAEGTGASPSAPAPSSSDEPAPTSANAPSPTREPSSPPPPASSIADPTSREPDRTSAPAPSSPGTRSIAPPARTTEPPAPSRSSAGVNTAVVSTKALVSTEVAPTTTVITVISNGQTFQQTSVGSMTIEHTTGRVTETTLPAVGAAPSGGLSSGKKAIIGGVIGGVGGAILLGGIAIVCWRMWGKKKRVSEDDADLMAGTGAALGDKSHNNASPFQSNLEQYHNPGGRPNAAANF